MFYETEKNDHGLARPPFKSIAVPRPIAWISTLDENGNANIAPYSQFTNLTFDPPYILFSANRDYDGARKDTTNNIETTGEFVHNMVTYDLIDKMNITAAPFEPGVDEFERAGLTKEPSVMVKPPRVKESPIHLECKYVQTISIPGTSAVGTADVIIGKVVGIHINDEYILPNGKIDIEKIKPLARMGYSDYTVIEKIFEYVPSDAAGDDGDKALGLEGATGAFGKR